LNCTELTFFITGTTLDAFRLVDNVRYFLVTGDCFGRTIAGAEGTSDALRLIDNIAFKGLALSCRTLFVYNVSAIFISEVLHCGKHRIGGCLAETAKSGIFDYLAEILEVLQVIQCAFALAYLFQSLVHALVADTTR
jgi:hypothetical protein